MLENVLSKASQVPNREVDNVMRRMESMSESEKDVRDKIQNWLMAEGWKSLTSLTPTWRG